MTVFHYISSTLISYNSSFQQSGPLTKEDFFPKGDKRGGDLFEDPSLQSGVSSTHFLVDLDQDTQQVIPVNGE